MSGKYQRLKLLIIQPTSGSSLLTIDQTVLVPQIVLFELSFVGRIVQFLENVLEASIVLLEDGVLGAQIQRIFTVQCVFEGRVGKVDDAFVQVVHSLKSK
jgi:hypothetical protein